jgi:uncharacterized phage protein gp47/JayE
MTLSFLTAAGYSAPTAAEFLTEIRDRYVAKLLEAGLPTDVDWSDDQVLAMLTAICADVLGEVALGVQAIYDARDPNNAAGVALDNLCLLTGLSRNPATPSTVTLTCTGTVGTALPLGREVEGGGTDGHARWRTTEDAVIPGAGTVDVPAECTEDGPTAAAPGDIDFIVTAVSGWSSVTNAASAEAGSNIETDEELRARRLASLSIQSGTSVDAIRAYIVDLDFITAAVVVENTADVPAVVQGVSLDGHSIMAIVYPSSLSNLQKQEVARRIWVKKPAGIKTMGADVQTIVTGEDGQEHPINYNYATDINVDVRITLNLAPGISVVDVTPNVTSDVTAYFAGFSVGDAVRVLQIMHLLADYPDEIEGAVVELNDGSGWVTTDIEPALTELATLGIVTVI